MVMVVSLSFLAFTLGSGIPLMVRSSFFACTLGIGLSMIAFLINGKVVFCSVGVVVLAVGFIACGGAADSLKVTQVVFVIFVVGMLFRILSIFLMPRFVRFLFGSSFL